jgi:hypothetical protein
MIKHGFVVFSALATKQLHIYSLINGVLVRVMSKKGNGKGELNFNNGGLCTTPDGDGILVADFHNSRVQELRVTAACDDSWVRFIGEGVVNNPEYVDCNDSVIVVSEPESHISVLAWNDGSIRARCRDSGPCLYRPRLLADGSGFVVASILEHALRVYPLHGEGVVHIINQQGLYQPTDVIERPYDGSFIVLDGQSNVMRLCRDGTVVEMLFRSSVVARLLSGRIKLSAKPVLFDNRCTDRPITMVAMPNDGCWMLHRPIICCQQMEQVTYYGLRLAWMRACYF